MFETHVIFQDLSAVLLVGLEPIDRRCGPDSSMVPKGTRFFFWAGDGGLNHP